MIRKLLKRLVLWALDAEYTNLLHLATTAHLTSRGNTEGISSLVNSGRHLQNLIEGNKLRIENLQDKFSEQLHIGVDLHMNSPHKIIVLGKHKNHEMVRIYDVESDHLGYLIDVLRQMQNDYGRRTRITLDEWPHGIASVIRENLDR